MLVMDREGVNAMETDTVIEEVVSNFVETELTDGQIERAVGIVAGRLAARAFSERIGEAYEEDAN